VVLKDLFHVFFRSSKCADIWLQNCCVCKFKNTALVRLLMQQLMPMLLWLVYALGEGCGNLSHMVFLQSCAQELHIKSQIQENLAWLYKEQNTQVLGLNCLYPRVTSQLVHEKFNHVTPAPASSVGNRVQSEMTNALCKSKWRSRGGVEIS